MLIDVLINFTGVFFRGFSLDLLSHEIVRSFLNYQRNGNLVNQGLISNLNIKQRIHFDFYSYHFTLDLINIKNLDNFNVICSTIGSFSIFIHDYLVAAGFHDLVCLSRNVTFIENHHKFIFGRINSLEFMNFVFSFNPHIFMDAYFNNHPGILRNYDLISLRHIFKDLNNIINSGNLGVNILSIQRESEIYNPIVDNLIEVIPNYSNSIDALPHLHPFR